MLWCSLVFVLMAMAPSTRALSLFSYNPIRPLQGSKHDQWFLQKLDHFDSTNSKTWEQRYQVNGTWFKESKNSPIFLLVIGEGSIGSGNQSAISGEEFYMKYAEKFGAMCFILEHRYYGESRPTKNLSVENLRFLSSQQALRDIARFIVGINKMYELQPTNRWILFGGSYAGSLVAWARLKFPHLVHAAVASSAPLVAVVDFKGYLGAVKETLASSRESCAENFHQGALDIATLLKEPKGADLLTEKFKLSKPIDSLNQTSRFNSILSILAPFLSFVQYYDRFSTNVDDFCDIMVDESYGSFIDRYAAVNSLAKNHRHPNCDVTAENLKNLSYGSGCSIRQWIYQTCTEFGYFQTSSTKEELFGASLSLDLYVDECKVGFGDDFNLTRVEDGVQKTNTDYGGVNISVSRVVFTHGTKDPWRVLGIRKSSDPEMPVIIIQGGSHCNDMRNPQLYDSQSLKSARLQIMDLLGKWISESG